jgi:acetyltransferase
MDWQSLSNDLTAPLAWKFYLMSIRNFTPLFHPTSVAVIGASSRPHSLGETVLRNMMSARFHGAIFPVNPKYETLAGLQAYAKVSDLPVVPDLAVICTPPQTVPTLIKELGECGTKAAIVLTAGLSSIRNTDGQTLVDAMLANAKPYLLRILGPNCVGLLLPPIGLNASFAHTGALPGKLAFISQSGALVTAMLDWAKARGIGFSAFISVGDSLDVDAGDLLDYFALDNRTQAILMYIEDVKHARKFMSAARAAARTRPVIVVKAGRVAEAALAAASHTGALAGSDAVYDAAFRRAGMLRVLTTDELFSAVETLARTRPLTDEGLIIVTNGGGPGVMAVDALISSGGKLAALSDETRQKLDAVLPANWSHGNPVDIIGDAPVDRYLRTMEILLTGPEYATVLFIHAPTAIVPSEDIAEALAPLFQQSSRNVLACWLGADAVMQARQIFLDTSIPVYETPEDAVTGFMQIVQYQRNQQLLMQAPSSLSDEVPSDKSHASEVIQTALSANRNMLSEAEAKSMLSAYHIPVVDTHIVTDVNDAVRQAQEIGFPVALKILSPDITHKSDVGGVELDLDTPEMVQEKGSAMLARLHQKQPGARLEGFTVQKMVRRPHAHELILGVTVDRIFGPVILFGQGGIAVEAIADRAIALPPLNMALARDLLSRTRVAKLLTGIRGQPPAQIDAICRALVQLSQLVIDLPQVVELDINPLLADHEGVIALDARIRVVPETVQSVQRLAIRPYPKELEQWVSWRGETLLLRPIRPEDAAEHIRFFAALDAEDIYLRAFVRLRELTPVQVARLTQIDYDREMAFIAVRKRDDGSWEILGGARAVADPDNIEAEFSITVRSDMKGRGLGQLLLDKLVNYCRTAGIERLVADTLSYNYAMLKLARQLGFQTAATDDPTVTRLSLFLGDRKAR